MNIASSLPNYAELTTLLNKIQPGLHPAEAHGLLCGYLCFTSKPEKLDAQLEKFFLSGKKNKEARAILLQLYETSHHSLKQFSFDFNLILPDDDTDINVRAEALSLWCQGFLTGLAQSPTSLQNHPVNEVVEALNDLTEIAQLHFGNISPNEEDETAYVELTEYVRLSALLIFNELQSSAISPKIGTRSLLH